MPPDHALQPTVWAQQVRLIRAAGRAALVILMASSIGGCSISADTSLAEKQVPQFHALLDEGRTTEIYTQASEDLEEGGNGSRLRCRA